MTPVTWIGLGIAVGVWTPIVIGWWQNRYRPQWRVRTIQFTEGGCTRTWSWVRAKNPDDACTKVQLRAGERLVGVERDEL